MKETFKKNLDLILIVLVAFIYRTIHLFCWSQTPYFRTPSLDELYHHLWAGSIASGNLSFPGAFFRAPLYPYLLGAVYSFFGQGPWPSRIIQGLIGIAGCLLIYFLVLRISENRISAFSAGLILALSPMPVLFESRLLLDFLLVPLSALLLLIFIEATERKPLFSILAGLLSGIFACTRPNILAVFPFLLIWLFFASVKPRKGKIARVGIALLGFILAIAPVTIHNLHNNSQALISTQGGLNLYLGNNSATDGITPILPSEGGDWTLISAWRLAEKEVGRTLDSDELDSYYKQKAIKWAIHNPGVELKLLLNKILLLISGIEHGNNGSPEFFKTMSPVLHSPFSWKLLLPLFALILPLIRWNKKVLLLALFFFAYSATIVLFFVNARFRLPLLVPIIAIVAHSFGKNNITKSKPRIIAALLLFGLSFSLSFLFPAGKLGERGKAENFFALGNLYMREGAFEKADSLFALAIDISPSINRANLNRGIISFRKRDYTSSRNFFLSEIQTTGGKSALAYSNLCALSRITSDSSSALEFGLLSIKNEPLTTAPYINYAQSLLEFGLADSAFVIAKQGLEIDSLNTRLLNLVGSSALTKGHIDLAKSYLGKAIENRRQSVILQYELSSIYSIEAGGAEPDSIIQVKALYNLGLAHIAEGERDSALVFFKQAIAISPNFTQAHMSIGSIYEFLGKPDSALYAFEKALQLGARSPELYYNLGLVNAQLGEFSTAYTWFKGALELDSLFTPATDKLRLLYKLESENKISLE